MCEKKKNEEKWLRPSTVRDKKKGGREGYWIYGYMDMRWKGQGGVLEK